MVWNGRHIVAIPKNALAYVDLATFYKAIDILQQQRCNTDKFQLRVYTFPKSITYVRGYRRESLHLFRYFDVIIKNGKLDLYTPKPNLLSLDMYNQQFHVQSELFTNA
jgi:hypothetical protein